MNYLFTNIIGSFVFDETLKQIDVIPFRSAEDYRQKASAEAKLSLKYPHLRPVPKDKEAQALAFFHDQKYFSEFHHKNLSVTKQAIKASVNEDQLIIQTIVNMTELDKISNSLVKRLREWYALYCPEPTELIESHEQFVQLVLEESKEKILSQLNITETMGADLDKKHVEEMLRLAGEVKNLYALRAQYEQYLTAVMQEYCPNIMELAGVTIGARLLELARSLKHLALLPASTIQLFGAEKALFRHITTGARSPKYGVIIGHPLIQKAKRDEKGKAARCLADKLSLCARLDYFKGEFKAPQYKKELEEKFR